MSLGKKLTDLVKALAVQEAVEKEWASLKSIGFEGDHTLFLLAAEIQESWT